MLWNWHGGDIYEKPGGFTSYSRIFEWILNNFLFNIPYRIIHWSLGLILSTKIWVLRNFLSKIWEFWTPKFCQKVWQIFRQNILVQLAGQFSENFPLNILIGTHKKIWGNFQKSENFARILRIFLLIGLSPGLKQFCFCYIFLKIFPSNQGNLYTG